MLFGLFIFAFTGLLAPAQDAATQQLMDEINGRIQNLTEMQAAQGKKIAALEKQIGDLSDKLNQPAANNSASADDLKKLAEQVKDLAKKQQSDNDLVLKELEKLAKGGGVSAPPRSKPPAVSNDNPAPAPSGGKQNGYYYPVKRDDNLTAIAKAYSAELKAKITVEQILAANPGLDPNKMPVGKKIFIPDPNAK
jgi:septal ring factor EnvC (AmiA/AmiB activator)